MPQQIFYQTWTLIILIFVAIVGTGLSLLMLINLSIINTIFSPILQYMSLFLVLWQDDPFGALQFIATKSIVAFAHTDARSGLNLWTYEIDSITLFVYLFSAVLFAKVASRHNHSTRPPEQKNLKLALVGSVFMSFSFTYMTAIEHCAGPTWVGFVMLYGLGFEGFQLTPIYQWAGGIVGATFLGIALFNHSSDNSDTIPKIFET
ncbi:MAG: hypothetical protein ACC707_17665 [Thiohalomonadales bacterium]